jgi:hypothetical protein
MFMSHSTNTEIPSDVVSADLKTLGPECLTHTEVQRDTRRNNPHNGCLGQCQFPETNLLGHPDNPSEPGEVQNQRHSQFRLEKRPHELTCTCSTAGTAGSEQHVESQERDQRERRKLSVAQNTCFHTHNLQVLVTGRS